MDTKTAAILIGALMLPVLVLEAVHTVCWIRANRWCKKHDLRLVVWEDADDKCYWHGEDEAGNKWLPTEDGGKFLALGKLKRMY